MKLTYLKTTLSNFATLAGFGCAFATTASAEAVAYEGFDIPAGSFDGASGETSFGWFDVWSVVHNQTISAEGLSYGNLATTGGALELSDGTTPSQKVGDIAREIDEVYFPTSPGELWMSVLIQPNIVAGSPADGGFIQVVLGNGATNSLYLGTAWRGSVWSVGGERASPKTVNSSVPVEHGVTTLLVMRLDFTTDTGSFWVNPDISANTAPSEPVGTFSLLSDFEADRVTVWFSNYIDDGEVFIDYTGSKVDEIRFGTDWSSVIVLGEGGGGDETWGGFDIDDDNNVDTGEWMKWLYVEQAPWIWSYKFKKWLYIEEGNIADNGTWAYIPGDTSPETPGTGTTWSGFSVDANNNADTGEWMGWVQVASTPWIWSYDLGQWIYIEEGFIGSDGAWGFISR